jgi:hypothetical protein
MNILSEEVTSLSASARRLPRLRGGNFRATPASRQGLALSIGWGESVYPAVRKDMGDSRVKRNVCRTDEWASMTTPGGIA